MEFEHKSINYIEYSANNLMKTKAFFKQVFGWTFQDYGEEYSAFEGKGLMGGFYCSANVSVQNNGGALLVFYSDNLEQTAEEVEQAGGKVSKAIFDFPGGRRFHFLEPSGNEMAVWSEK